MDLDSPFFASFSRMHAEFVKALRSFGDCDIYADKIEQWSKEKLMTSFMDVAEPTRCGFLALNHGDLWLNNMMFKSDDKHHPIDVIMYDYQGSFFASPANDVLYFLISSVSDDVKVEHFDDLIEFYQHELSEALQKLGYEKHIPNLSEIFLDFMEKGHFGKNIIYNRVIFLLMLIIISQVHYV